MSTTGKFEAFFRIYYKMMALSISSQKQLIN